MAKIRLSTGDLAREAIPTEEVMSAAYAAFYGINATARAGAKPGEGVPLRAGTVVEGLFALSAMIIDAMPEVKTNADRRAMADDAAARILVYLKQFREHFDATGEHIIATFGPVLAPDRDQMQ